MSADDIIKIIDAIPQYIKYIYPGYIVLYLYTFFRSYKLKDSKGIIIKSIGISYIINLLVQIIVDMFKCKNIYLYNALLIVLSLIIAYTAFFFIENKLNKLLTFLNIKTSTLLNEISSLSKGDEYIYLRVFLKDKPIVYEGYLVDYEAECTEEKRFLILNEYTQFFIDESYKHTEEMINFKKFYGKPREKVLIYFDNIDRIEKCSYKRIKKYKEPQ